MANKYKMVDGQSIQLSDDEQTAVDNEQAAATSAIYGYSEVSKCRSWQNPYNHYNHYQRREKDVYDEDYDEDSILDELWEASQEDEELSDELVERINAMDQEELALEYLTYRESIEDG